MNKGGVNPAYAQLATIYTWTLCATCLGVPKDIRQLIAQEYLWDDTIQRHVESEWTRFYRALYRSETIQDVAQEGGLLGMAWRAIAQFLGMLCMGFVFGWMRKYLF